MKRTDDEQDVGSVLSDFRAMDGMLETVCNQTLKNTIGSILTLALSSSENSGLGATVGKTSLNSSTSAPMLLPSYTNP